MFEWDKKVCNVVCTVSIIHQQESGPPRVFFFFFGTSGSRAERIANRQLIVMTEFCLFCNQWVTLIAKRVILSILIKDGPFQLPCFFVFTYSSIAHLTMSEHVISTWTQNTKRSLSMVNKPWGKKAVELHNWRPSSATWSMPLHSFSTLTKSNSQQIVFPQNRQSYNIWPNKNQIFTFGKGGEAK